MSTNDSSASGWWGFQRSRALALIRRRPFRVRRGSGPVLIETLASPLRYDIVLRRDLLAELRTRLDAPLVEQVSWARGTPYWDWFRDVRWVRASARFKASHSGIEAAFHARVRGAVALCRSFATRGFDARFPVTLKSADRMLPAESGKRAEGTVVAGGGCHRIALLWLHGARELEPRHYVIHHYAELSPHDNTRLLRSLLLERRADYVRFISRAYMPSETANVAELLAWVEANAPTRSANLAAILRADAIVSVPEARS